MWHDNVALTPHRATSSMRRPIEQCENNADQREGGGAGVGAGTVCLPGPVMRRDRMRATCSSATLTLLSSTVARFGQRTVRFGGRRSTGTRLTL